MLREFHVKCAVWAASLSLCWLTVLVGLARDPWWPGLAAFLILTLIGAMSHHLLPSAPGFDPPPYHYFVAIWQSTNGDDVYHICSNPILCAPKRAEAASYELSCYRNPPHDAWFDAECAEHSWRGDTPTYAELNSPPHKLLWRKELTT